MLDAAAVRRGDRGSLRRSFFRAAPAQVRRIAPEAAREDPQTRMARIHAMIDALFEPPHPDHYRFRPE